MNEIVDRAMADIAKEIQRNGVVNFRTIIVMAVMAAMADAYERGIQDGKSIAGI